MQCVFTFISSICIVLTDVFDTDTICRVHRFLIYCNTLDRATPVPSRSRLCAIFKKVDHSCRPQFGFGAGYLSNQDLFSAILVSRALRVVCLSEQIAGAELYSTVVYRY